MDPPLASKSISLWWYLEKAGLRMPLCGGWHPLAVSFQGTWLSLWGPCPVCTNDRSGPLLQLQSAPLHSPACIPPAQVPNSADHGQSVPVSPRKERIFIQELQVKGGDFKCPPCSLGGLFLKSSLCPQEQRERHAVSMCAHLVSSEKTHSIFY